MRVQTQGRDFRTVWAEGLPAAPVVRMIDQTRLPFEFVVHEAPDVNATSEAIRDMTVRGAGAIGAAAAFGMAQGFSELNPLGARRQLEATRPTAQNLFYATKRVFEAAERSQSPVRTAWEEAQQVADEDADACRRIGEYGAELIPDNGVVVTHCNAGWLAFVDWGSALSPVYVAHRAGRKVKVFADETRPRQQGGRLTAWELHNEGIEHEISPDTGIVDLLKYVKVDLVIVGADRIAENGDTANKIGTHMVALAAREFGVPFYVAAPTSTIDLDKKSGQEIPIESRSDEEVQYITGQTEDGRIERVLVVNPGSPARNRGFDVTPAHLITGGIITQNGIIRPKAEDIQAVKLSRQQDFVK